MTVHNSAGIKYHLNYEVQDAKGGLIMIVLK